MGGLPSRRFLCLFWRETRQRVFGLEISAWPEEVTGREKRVGWREELTRVGDGDGQMRSTPDTVAEKIGSSEEDRVKRCRHSSCFVEFSLVIHASVSPYMLSEM